MRYKLSAICFAIIGIVAIPVCHLLFPFAQRASAHPMPDGTLAVFSPTEGAWIYTVGFVAAGAFLLLATVMFALSFRKKG